MFLSGPMVTPSGSERIPPASTVVLRAPVVALSTVTEPGSLELTTKRLLFGPKTNPAILDGGGKITNECASGAVLFEHGVDIGVSGIEISIGSECGSQGK